MEGPDVPFEGKATVVNEEIVPFVSADVTNVVEPPGAFVKEEGPPVPVALTEELTVPPLLPEVPMLAQVVSVTDPKGTPVGDAALVGLEELPKLAPVESPELGVAATPEPDAEPLADVVSLEETADPELESDLGDPLLPVCRLETPGFVKETPPSVVEMEVPLTLEMAIVPDATVLACPEPVADGDRLALVCDELERVPLRASAAETVVPEVDAALPVPMMVVEFVRVV